MKKQITAYEILNEPGDCTRYHYYMVEGEDAFYFAGINDLNYPKQISKAMLKEIDAEKISVKYMGEFLYSDMQKAQKERDFLHQIGKNNGGANIWTVAECARATRSRQ